MEARFRALKRLALQGHDFESEHEFFAREVRAARFVSEWPWPKSLKRRSAWTGAGRFWFGLGYEVFGGLGSSVLRPAIWWIVIVIVAANFYLSQHEGTIKTRSELKKQGTPHITALIQANYMTWSEDKSCYSATAPNNPTTTYFGGLSDKVHDSTNAAYEALQLSLRNALVVLDNSSDAAHRSFGCLYGVELYGGNNPVPYVPGAVSIFSAFQKAFSATLLFLFGLALRNMLKMK